MRTMGIDVGTRTLGIAISDPLGLTARGLTTVRRVGLRQDLEAVAKLVGEWEVDRIVVGMPIRTDGSVGPEAQKTMVFIHDLQEKLGLPVESWDERFSTKEAERAMIAADVKRSGRRKLIDQVAAAVILQGFLDRHRQ